MYPAQDGTQKEIMNLRMNSLLKVCIAGKLQKSAGNGSNIKKRKHWLQEALYDEKSADEKSGDGEL
jgi:hypothetical protein